MVNSFFDEVYLINLKHREDRFEQFRQMADCNRFHFRRIEAINKTDLHLSTGQAVEENDRRMGELACKMSHVEAINAAIENNHESILIFEDDADLLFGWEEKLIKSIADLPADWEMFYLGVNDINKTKQFVTNHLCKIWTGYTTHAYAIHERAYKPILKALYTRAPIDVIYAEYIHPKGNSYCMPENIAVQRDGFSDITNNNEKYNLK
jgi:GR25 family glycosyltransferase involved in LPS biosynthesis